MAELNRLDWAAGACLIAFGVRVGVRVDDPVLMPKVLERLPPGSRRMASDVVDHLYSIRGGGAVPGSNARRFYLVYSGLAPVARALDEEAALEAFESAVRFDVAGSAGRWVFVHAGVVEWKRRAIVIPAPSGRGKSHLVESLVRAGATYFSDEFAVFDNRGRVHPFAKPLSLRREGGLPHRIAIGELGGSVGVRPAPVGLVLSTRYESGRFSGFREMTAGEALLALLANTVRARAAPAQTLKVLACAVDGAMRLEGPRGDANEVAHQLLGGSHAQMSRSGGFRVAALS